MTVLVICATDDEARDFPSTPDSVVRALPGLPDVAGRGFAVAYWTPDAVEQATPADVEAVESSLMRESGRP